MEILVKKDIIDELQTKGVFSNKEEGNKFIKEIINEIAKSLEQGFIVRIENFGLLCTKKGLLKEYIQYQSKKTKKVKEEDKNKEKEFKILEYSQLIKNISSNLKLSENEIEIALNTFFHFIKDKVLKGFEVQIIDFISFRIEEKKSHIITDNRTGKKRYVPPKKILIFEPEKSFLKKSKAKALFFVPDKDFEEHIKKLNTANILIVVPKIDAFVSTVQFYFEKVGWKVNVAQSVEEGIKYLKSKNKPYLVILDSLVENYQKFCEELKCNIETNLIPLIVMYPKDTDLKKLKYFKVCGDEDIIQPFELKQFLGLVESVLRRTLEEESIFNQEVLLKFPTRDEYIEKSNEICAKLFAMAGLSEDDQTTLNAAFREALANAAQHGNKHRRDKLLEVYYLLDKEKVTISVTDSGFGFDWRAYLNSSTDAIGRARQRHKEGRLGGLGIMLMKRCVDKIEYNEKGNTVTLTKYIRKKRKKEKIK